MSNVKKRLWGLLLMVSLILILANYMSVVDFVSRRSYLTFEDNELTEMFLEAEFIAGEELVLEYEWEHLIEHYSYYKKGELHKGVLSDGRAVIVVSKSYMGDFETDRPIRGLFDDIPEEVAYLTDELGVEPYVFYCFENFLSRTRTEFLEPSLLAFFVGLAGVFVWLGILLARWFPDLFPALFKRAERKEKGVRDSNFELLRILCMIMIIMQHFGFWGEFEAIGEPTVNAVILQCIVNAGKIGVNCFMMITGYYCIFGSFKASKITKLVAKVWFYTWGIGIILFSSGVGIRSVENLVKTVFPVCSGAFWFITIYLIVYVLSPYINQAVLNIDKEKFKALLVFLFVIWSIIPSIVKPGWECSNIGWLIFMYLLGAYFRRFPEVFAECRVKPLLIFAGVYALLNYLTLWWNSKVEAVVYNQVLAQKHTVLIVICSAALFVLFKNINIGQRKIVNKIASATFGVYLIHENPVLNDLLWTKWLNVNMYFESENFGWYALGVIMLVYVVCTVVDMVLMEICRIIFKGIDYVRIMNYNKNR